MAMGLERDTPAWCLYGPCTPVTVLTFHGLFTWVGVQELGSDAQHVPIGTCLHPGALQGQSLPGGEHVQTWHGPFVPQHGCRMRHWEGVCREGAHAHQQRDTHRPEPKSLLWSQTSALWSHESPHGQKQTATHPCLLATQSSSAAPGPLQPVACAGGERSICHSYLHPPTEVTRVICLGEKKKKMHKKPTA